MFHIQLFVWAEVVSIFHEMILSLFFFLKMQTNEKLYAKSKPDVWGFSFCFPSSSHVFASIFLLLEP